jgi:translation elongation factor EF-G
LKHPLHDIFLAAIDDMVRTQLLRNFEALRVLVDADEVPQTVAGLGVPFPSGEVEPFDQEPLAPVQSIAMLEGKVPEGKPKGKVLVETLVEAGLPRDEAKRVLDVHGGAMFIDSTKGVQYLQEIMELLLKAFEEAVDKGPLAKEKVVGLKVKLHDAIIHEDPAHRGPAQIIPAVRRASELLMTANCPVSSVSR